MSYTLIIDQGGHSTRAIVFNKKGLPLAYNSEPVSDPLSSSEVFIEYSAETIITSAHLLLKRLAQQLKPKQLNKISAIGIIAQRSSLIACNKTTGQAITPMISWQDTRNVEWLSQQEFHIEQLHELTGLRLNAHAGASKIRWLLDNNKEIQMYAGNANLLFVPWGAYFLSQLANTSLLVTDPILASRTGLTEFGSLDWSAQLLSLFDISRDFLPTIVPTSYDYGEIALEENSIPIKLLGGDQNFIPCAYGKESLKHSVFLNAGTGAFIQAADMSKEKKKGINTQSKNINKLLRTTIGIEKQQTPINIIEGTINAAATALDWWQTQLERPYAFTELEYLLETVTEAPIFINTLSGTGSPYWLPQQETYFSNKDDNKIFDDEQKTIAVLESILFACKANFNIIYASQKNITQVIVSGGILRSNELCQKLSTLLNITVIRYQDSEASARGAAFYLRDKKRYESIQAVTTFKPDSSSNDLISRFKHYCHEMKKLSLHDNSIDN